MAGLGYARIQRFLDDNMTYAVVGAVLQVKVPGNQGLVPSVLRSCGVEGKLQATRQSDAERVVKAEGTEAPLVALQAQDSPVHVLGLDQDLFYEGGDS